METTEQAKGADLEVDSFAWAKLLCLLLSGMAPMAYCDVLRYLSTQTKGSESKQVE